MFRKLYFTSAAFAALTLLFACAVVNAQTQTGPSATPAPTHTTRPNVDFVLSFSGKGLVPTGETSTSRSLPVSPIDRTRGGAADVERARVGEQLVRSSPALQTIVNSFSRKLSTQISRGEIVTLRFGADGSITSSNPSILAKTGYDEYKQCVGDTWWAPGVAQILCLAAFI
jgi:PAS domain-containing protein